jgi:hypothetical protein
VLAICSGKQPDSRDRGCAIRPYITPAGMKLRKGLVAERERKRERERGEKEREIEERKKEKERERGMLQVFKGF